MPPGSVSRHFYLSGLVYCVPFWRGQIDVRTKKKKKTASPAALLCY